MTAIFFAAIIIRETSSERKFELELKSTARQGVFLVLLLAMCGAGIVWSKRQFEAGTHFGYGEDILYGRIKDESAMKAIKAIETTEAARLD